MNQDIEDWADMISKGVAAIGIVIAALNYYKQGLIKKAEWLTKLYEKFYEG